MTSYLRAEDVQAAKADEWLNTAKAKTQAWLTSFTGAATPMPDQTAPQVEQTPAMPQIKLPSAEELRALAPWRDLDPLPQQQPQQQAPAAANGAPVAMPTTGGAISQEPGDLRMWARQEAQRLGIDPDIAERVALSEGGFDDPVRQSDVVYQGEREQSYGPYQLNVNGGLGNEALARGIDPRKPEHARAAVTFALEHAARNGWGAFHGAARVGVGERDGIGQAPAQGPRMTTPPQAEQTPTAQAQAFAAGSWTPNQIESATAEGLDYETALAVCGPAAAIAFARKNGRNPTMSEAVALAREVGWTPQRGMAGTASQQKLLERMGVAARLVDGAPDWRAVAADVQRGNPVTISTPGHYFVAERYDPESGMFDFGQSAKVLKASGGRTWFRPEELVNLGMGDARATLFIDNPESPTPSIAAGDMPRLSLNAAQPLAPGGSAAPPAPGGVSSAPSGAPPAPWEMPGASDGGPMMLKENDETAAFLPGDGGVAPTPEYDPRDADAGPRESRPAPIMPTDPTVSDPAYTQNPNAAPMVDPLDPSTITPAALPPMPNGPRMMQPQPQHRDPREGQGIIARGIDAIGQYLPSAPIVDTKPGDAGAFMGGMPNTAGKLWEWRGRVAEGAADALSRGTGMDPDALVLNVEVGGIPIQMTVSELLENVTDPLLAAGWGVGDMVLDAAGRAVLRLVAPYAKGAARETIGRLLNSEPVQRGVEAVREGAEAVGRGLQGVGREVAGGLMDLNPAMTPRIIGDGPGIGRSMPGPDDVPTPSSLTPPAGGRPQQRTVEWLQEQIDYTRRVLADLDPATEGELIGQVQDRLARLQGEWVDATNARRALEPRIRSEVGRRVNELPIDERTASDFAGIGRERVSPDAGIPRTVDDTPRAPGLNSAIPGFDPTSAAMGGYAGSQIEGENGEAGDPLRTAAGILLAGVGGGMSPGARRALQNAMKKADALNAAGKADEAAAVVDAALRQTGGYNPRLSREPVLPGMEPPRRLPGDAGPSVSDAPNLPGNRLGNVPPSQLREPTLPGMEGPYTRPNIPDVSETPNRAPVLGDVPPSAVNQGALPGMDPVRDVQAPGPVGDIDAPRVPNIAGVQRAVESAQRRQAALAARGREPLSPLQWTRALAANIGYSSMIGPATATVNVFGNLLEPLWAAPKELARAIARGNPREAVEMAMGSFRGMADVGTAMVDAIMARGRYASNPDHPTLSAQTDNPILRAIATGTELGGRVFSGMPDAIFGTIARSAGEARRAAQIATDEGLKGNAWKQRVQTLLGEVEQFRKGELSLFPDQVDDIVKAGEDYADSQTFRQKLGTVGNGAAALAGRNVPVVGNLLTPFFNTPWNMGVTLAERTLIGAVMNRQKGFDKAYDAMVGSALLTGLVVGPAAAGNITGSGPNDPEKRKMLEAEGWKPYHTLIDGVYVPNRVFGIYGKLLNAVGEAHDAMAYQKKDGNVGSEALRRFGLLLKEEPYLQGLSDIMQAINAPNGSGLSSYGSSTLTRMIPYAATARAIGTAMDPNERTVDSGKTVPWQENVTQRVQQGVGLRSGLPVAQTALGDPKENPQQELRAVLPAMRDAKSEPLVRAFLDAGVDIAAPPADIDGVPLTPAQQRQFQQVMGRELRRIAGPSVSAEAWKNTPPNVRKTLLETFQSTAKTLAEVAVSSSAGPEFSRQRSQKVIDKALGR